MAVVELVQGLRDLEPREALHAADVRYRMLTPIGNTWPYPVRHAIQILDER